MCFSFLLIGKSQFEAKGHELNSRKQFHESMRSGEKEMNLTWVKGHVRIIKPKFS